MTDGAPPAPLSPRLSFAAALLLLALVGASLALAPGPGGVFGALLGALMLAIALVDARDQIIPDEFSAAAAALALIQASFVAPGAGWMAAAVTLAGAALAAAPFWLLRWGYRRWRGRDGLGLGDVKLAAVAGAWLHLTTVAIAVDAAALAALIAVVIRSRRRGEPLSAATVLPFGLFLAPAIWLGWALEALMAR